MRELPPQKQQEVLDFADFLHQKVIPRRPFDPKQWEEDMKVLTNRAEEIPVLPSEAFTRESIYGNHD